MEEKKPEGWNRPKKRTMARYMNRFGFDRKPELDYPPEEMSSSGEYLRGRILPPTSPRVDVGRMGIGQDKLAVVPLQMAEVAAAVAYLASDEAATVSGTTLVIDGAATA